MTFKSSVRAAVSLLPAKVALLRGGALLPPPLRSTLTLRLFNMLANCTSLPAELDTNLGIDSRLRVTIASHKSHILFGAPHLNIGERSSLDLALALFRCSDCFVDVGSNIGLFVFYIRCRNSSSKPVYFFEPDPTLFSNLEKNCHRNALKNAQGFRAAMSERSGQTIFYRNKSDDSSGTLVREDWSSHVLEPIKVDTVSFADFAEIHELKNICAKVDVEGAELSFFNGAKPGLERLNYLIIEILGPAIQRELPARMIREGKFYAYYINDYRLEHSQAGENRYVSPFYNWLFCREPPSSLRTTLQGTRFRVVPRNDIHAFEKQSLYILKTANQSKRLDDFSGRS